MTKVELREQLKADLAKFHGPSTLYITKKRKVKMPATGKQKMDFRNRQSNGMKPARISSWWEPLVEEK